MPGVHSCGTTERTSGGKPNIPSSPATTVAKLLERNSWRGTCRAPTLGDTKQQCT